MSAATPADGAGTAASPASTVSTATRAANLPNDLAALTGELDAIDAQARHLVADLCETRINWQPDAGRAWSVGQCVEHLAASNRVYVAAIRTAVGRARATGKPNRPIAPGWLARKFIATLEPPVRLKIKTPTKTAPPSTVHKDEALAAFLQSQDEVRRLIAECATLDPNAARFPNPFITGLNWTIGSGLRIIAAHDRRHLWQALQVRQRPDFPAALQ
jgi:hypothetical protein